VLRRSPAPGMRWCGAICDGPVDGGGWTLGRHGCGGGAAEVGGAERHYGSGTGVAPQ
jgi:hypothetical protein